MSINTVDASTLKNWLDKSEAILVDVREPGENRAESIPSAQLLSLGQVSLQTLPDSEEKKIVIHCRSGQRSRTACETLLAQNPKLDIYNLEGGLLAWKQAGFPVKTAKDRVLPLPQQVQVIIGSSITLSVLLGYLLSPHFFTLAGLLGFGLLYNGLTGWCALAKFLAKMPWNQ